MTGHRALEKKQITQGNNRKVQNPGESLKETRKSKTFSFLFLFTNSLLNFFSFSDTILETLRNFAAAFRNFDIL